MGSNTVCKDGCDSFSILPNQDQRCGLVKLFGRMKKSVATVLKYGTEWASCFSSLSLFLTCDDQSATVKSYGYYENTTNLHIRKSGRELLQPAYTALGLDFYSSIWYYETSGSVSTLTVSHVSLMLVKISVFQTIPPRVKILNLQLYFSRTSAVNNLSILIFQKYFL